MKYSNGNETLEITPEQSSELASTFEMHGDKLKNASFAAKVPIRQTTCCRYTHNDEKPTSVAEGYAPPLLTAS